MKMTALQKLETLFQSLSFAEIRDLSKKINQLSSTDKVWIKVKKLFYFLKNTSWTTLYPDEVFRKIYPPNEQENHRISDVYGRLKKVIEDFLVAEEIKSNEQQYSYLLLQSLYKRNIKKLGQEKIQKSLKDFKTFENKFNLEIQKIQFETHLLNFNFISENNRVLSEKQKKHLVVNLSTSTTLLNVYLIATALRHACLILSYQQLNDSSGSEEQLNESSDNFLNNQQLNESSDNFQFYQSLIIFLESPELKALQKIPIVKLYYLGFKLMTEANNGQYFSDLKKLGDDYFGSVR